MDDRRYCNLTRVEALNGLSLQALKLVTCVKGGAGKADRWQLRERWRATLLEVLRTLGLTAPRGVKRPDARRAIRRIRPADSLVCQGTGRHGPLAEAAETLRIGDAPSAKRGGPCRPPWRYPFRYRGGVLVSLEDLQMTASSGIALALMG